MEGVCIYLLTPSVPSFAGGGGVVLGLDVFDGRPDSV